MSRKLFLTLALTFAPLSALAGNPVENSYGISGSTSGTVTIRTLTGTYNFNLPATAGTSGQPLLSGGGSAAMTWGSRSGNTTTFATSTGTLIAGNCVKIDASGNFQDAGAACGTGTLATQAANTALANVTGSTASPTAVSLPSCADTGGNHLNYTSGTGFSCGTTVGSTGGSTRLVLNVTSVGNGADLTEDTGQSYTMPGGTFTSGWIEIHAAGTFVGSANTKLAAIYFGGTKIGNISTASGTVVNWRLSSRIYYVDSTHQWVETTTNSATSGLSSATTSAWQQVGSITNDTTASITIKTTVQNGSAATANTVTSNILVAEMFP